MRTNSEAAVNLTRGFGLKMFSEDELYAIHLATLQVLERTGIKVESEEALEIFDAGGAKVNKQTHLVKFPAYIVEDAIRSAPSKVVLNARNPVHNVILEGKRVHFTNFGEGIMVIDPFTGAYRKSTKQDCANAALICDALDEVDVILRAVAAHDVFVPTHALHEMEVCFHNTSKPVFNGGVNARLAEYLFQMGAAVCGGMDKFKERPILSLNVCPTSPLQLTSHCTDAIIKCAEYGVPVNILSMAMAGGSSPVTLGGTLVTHNAEVLSGVILNQLTRKGAPVIYGSSTTMMDLKTTTAPVGAPELGMINAAVAALAQYYLLPSWVAGG
ncbi:trimethylamine methyltransferase [Candidatus Formimonas warabiya]|uniref:Trimethylamine methyltransferase n=1 Tax=Formimonas warabiya TaxID=1761012 RepID=A0A3G1KY93_FORW1|nr:trimethylamine methyltransferase [Candidatus Formimonas warabiya]